MLGFFSDFSVGLRQRWLRGSMSLVFGAMLVAITLFSLFIYNHYYTTLRTGLESRVRTATDFFANFVGRSHADLYNSAFRFADTFSESDRLELQFIDVNGSIMISSLALTAGTELNTPDVIEAFGTRQISSWVGRGAATGERVMAFSAPILTPDGEVIALIRFITSLRLVDRQVFRDITVVFGIGAILMLLVFVMNLVFLRSVITPVSEITKVSKRIADGSYGIQISNSYKDEIGDMVSSINEMSYKIAQTEKIQSEFISSVSHELRTPLTAITGWGETLIFNDELDEESKRGIMIMLKEARRLTKMVEELLEFTKIEDGRFTLNIDMIDIAAELEDAIFTFRELLHQDEIVFGYRSYLGENLLIPGDPNRLKQVFLNLFDNAAKYGREGKRIEVSIRRHDTQVRIDIRDFGRGLPENELGNIKKKFYKGSNSKDKGSGIGLAICEEIIKYHNGSLEFANVESGGFCATILLPVNIDVK